MHIDMLKWVLVHCTLMSLELKAAFHGSRVGNFGCSSVIHLCGVHSFCTRGIPIETNHGWQVLYWSLSWRRNILWVSCLKLSLGCVQNLQLFLVCLFEFGGYPLYVRHVLYISLLKKLQLAADSSAPSLGQTSEKKRKGWVLVFGFRIFGTVFNVWRSNSHWSIHIPSISYCIWTKYPNSFFQVQPPRPQSSVPM